MKTEFNFIQVIGRIKKALNISNDCELADMIGMKHTTFNSRKKANSIPYDAFIQLASTKNLDLNWLITGEGEMYQQTTQPVEYKNTRYQRMLELMDVLTEKQQQELLAIAEEKERFNQMERNLLQLYVSIQANGIVANNQPNFA